MIHFNISYSLLSVWKQSQLQFYFQKVKKLDPDTKVKECYGDAGNCVHTAEEKYIDEGVSPSITLYEEWKTRDLENKMGFSGQPLKISDYQKCANNGKQIIDELKADGWTLKTEVLIERKFKNTDINLKGYIDVIAYKDDKVMLIDWKTNSKVMKEHKDQQSFYAYLYYLKYGKIPEEYHWYYLKINKELTQKNLSKSDIKKVEDMVQEFIDTVNEYGDDVSKYSAGDYKQPFNSHLGYCEKEVMRRMNQPSMKFNIEIKGNYARIEGDMSDLLHNVLEKQMSYTESSAFFKIKATKEYIIKQQVFLHGDINKAKDYAKAKTENIGKHCIYKRGCQSFPVGMLDKVKKILQDYADYKKCKLNLTVDDKREANTIVPIPEITSDKVLRPYQQDAIDEFMSKPCGILALATGAGKTFVAAHIISQMKRKTLIIVDRIELLDQWFEVLEDCLKTPIGYIGDGNRFLENITIATVQTISRGDLDSETREWLNGVSFVIVDEFHKSATEQFYDAFAKIPNAKYRLGLTGTPKRNDGKEMEMFGLIGDVLMECPASLLIMLGYLMKPEIVFLKVPISNGNKKNYSKDYEHSVVNNPWRNAKIKQIVDNNKDKKILILTKLVKKHGDVLNEVIEGSYHISSQTAKKDRKEIMKKFKQQDAGALISTTQIASTGLDVEDLDIIINTAANTSDITSIQSLGRVLRTSKGKENAIYYDFVDAGKFTAKGSAKRIKQFKAEGHEVRVE